MNRLDLDVTLKRGSFRLRVAESLELSGIVAIFGANGSGKTSLLRVIAGLEPEARGIVSFGDTQWQGPNTFVRPERRGIGYVFQEGRLFSHLDVAGNLRFAERSGRRKGPLHFDATVEAFGLTDLLKRPTESLSGGERQRVAIARALLASPDLLLMDEPLSSLDNPRKAELLPLIHTLPGRFGVPVVLVTHDIDELVYLSDAVVLLAEGQRAARGTASEILERGDFRQLTNLDEPGSVLQATITRHEHGMSVVEVEGCTLRIPRVGQDAGETASIRIQPRDVVLALEPVRGISIRNCLPTSVRSLDELPGDQVLVHLSVGLQRLKARVTTEAARELKLAEGLDIYALIKAVALDPLSTRR